MRLMLAENWKNVQTLNNTYWRFCHGRGGEEVLGCGSKWLATTRRRLTLMDVRAVGGGDSVTCIAFYGGVIMEFWSQLGAAQ